MEIMTLKQLKDAPADMFTTVFIGNRMTREAYWAEWSRQEGIKMCKVLIFGETTEGRTWRNIAVKTGSPLMSAWCRSMEGSF